MCGGGGGNVNLFPGQTKIINMLSFVKFRIPNGSQSFQAITVRTSPEVPLLWH